MTPIEPRFVVSVVSKRRRRPMRRASSSVRQSSSRPTPRHRSEGRTSYPMFVAVEMEHGDQLVAYATAGDDSIALERPEPAHSNPILGHRCSSQREDGGWRRTPKDVSWTSASSRRSRHAKITRKVRIYDLRHTYATAGARGRRGLPHRGNGTQGSLMRRSMASVAIALSARKDWRRGRDSNPRYGYPYT